MTNLYSLLLVLCFVISIHSSVVYAKDNLDDAANVVKIAIADNIPPFQYLDENNKPAGLVVDLWQLWKEKAGAQIEFIPSSWPNTIKNLRNNRVDVHGALSRSADRETEFSFDGFVYSVAVSVYVHKDLVGISNLEDLTPVLVGVIKNTAFEKLLIEKNPNVSFRYFDNRNDLFAAAEKGEVKTFVTFDYLSFRHHNLPNLNLLYPAYKRLDLGSVEVNYAVKNNNKSLIDKLNKGFSLITKQERVAIDRKWLGVSNDNSTILLGLSIGNEPYMGLTSNGEATGLFVDLWKKWAEKTKTNVEFMPNTMALSLLALKEGKSHVHIGYPESELVNSGQPQAHHLYSVFSNIFVGNNYDDSKGIAQLKGKKVGLFVTAPYKNEFTSTYPDFNVVWFKALDDMLNAAINGEIDAFVSANQIAKARLVKNNAQNMFRVINDISYEAKIYSIVNDENRVLIDKIKEGFSLISRDELMAVEDGWIEDPIAKYFSNGYLKFNLTQQELHWLEDVPQATVGIIQDWLPYEKMEQNGQAVGINADVFSLASKLTGQEYRFVAYPTWEALLSSFKQGDIDMIANISATEERKQFAHFTTSYWDTPWSVITEKSVKPFDNLGELRGKPLAVIQGYQIINEVYRRYPDILIKVVDNLESGLQLLKQGKVDGLLDSMVASAHYLKENELYQYKMHLMKDLSAGTSHIGIRKGLQVQAEIMQKVVEAITDQDREKILNKWFKLDVEAGISYDEYFRNITTAVVISGLIIAFVLSSNRRLKLEIYRRHKAEDKLKQLAAHDSLTGLPNRNLLYDRISQALSNHARTQKQLAVMFLDLDGFKQINDNFGHDIGDQVLQEVSTRLKGLVRESDTVARIGGDEFILLITNLENSQQAAHVAEKAIIDISQPYVLSERQVSLGVSIGIALYPKDALDMNELLKQADDAMYKVKHNEKNSYTFA